jgi:hypothetical protein
LRGLSIGGRSAGDKLCDCGSRGCVLGKVVTVVDVDADRRLSSLDIAWDSDSRLRAEVSRAFEEDLGASSVELGITLVCIVQCEDLGARKVVTALKTLGKNNGEEAVVVDDSVSAPSLVRCCVAIVEELEPAFTGTYSC